MPNVGEACYSCFTPIQLPEFLRMARVRDCSEGNDALASPLGKCSLSSKLSQLLVWSKIWP